MLQHSEWVQTVSSRLAAMSDLEIVACLVLAALLSAFLFHKHRQRVGSRPLQSENAHCPVKPIEVSRLRPAVEAARGDYLAARKPARGVLFHKGLLALTRRAVAGLPYFQAHASHPEPEAPLD